MARSNSPEALAKYGFTFLRVKEWRQREHEAGRASGYDDFLRAHGICVNCGGHGTLVVGVRWRNENGTERSEQGPVASLIQRHGLDNPQQWLTESLKWDYLYEICECCNGLGMADSSPDLNTGSSANTGSFPLGLLDEITAPRK